MFSFGIMASIIRPFRKLSYLIADNLYRTEIKLADSYMRKKKLWK